MAADGMGPAGGSAEQFHDKLERDVAKRRQVVETGNIKPDS